MMHRGGLLTMARSLCTRAERLEPGRWRAAMRGGMTLIELLVVIAIVGALAALVLPAVQAAREAARRSQCANNLRQQALAVDLYADQHDGRFPPLWHTARLQPWQNFPWRIFVLPHLELRQVHDALNLSAEPLATGNREVLATYLPPLQCPSTPDFVRRIDELGAGAATTAPLQAAAHDYVAVHDVSAPEQQYPFRGAFNGGPDLQSTAESLNGGDPTSGAPYDRLSPELRVMAGRRRLIVDGLSNTALLVEQAGKPMEYGPEGAATVVTPREGAWGTSDFSSFDADGVNRNNHSGVYGFHRGAHAAMADGSVHLWDAAMAGEVVVALLSRDAGEIVAPGDWQ